MKFNLLIIFLLTISCTVQINNSSKKSSYTSSGFAYVYNENDFDELKEIPAVLNIISDEKRGQLNTDKNSGFIFENDDEDQDQEYEEKVIEKDRRKENFKIGDVEISFDDI